MTCFRKVPSSTHFLSINCCFISSHLFLPVSSILPSTLSPSLPHLPSSPTSSHLFSTIFTLIFFPILNFSFIYSIFSWSPFTPSHSSLPFIYLCLYDPTSCFSLPHFLPLTPCFPTIPVFCCLLYVRSPSPSLSVFQSYLSFRLSLYFHSFMHLFDMYLLSFSSLSSSCLPPCFLLFSCHLSHLLLNYLSFSSQCPVLTVGCHILTFCHVPSTSSCWCGRNNTALLWQSLSTSETFGLGAKIMWLYLGNLWITFSAKTSWFGFRYDWWHMVLNKTQTLVS